MEKVLLLEGLDCANCGEKIRAKAEKQDYIKSAGLNFMARTLRLGLSKELAEAELVPLMQSLVDSIEDGVTVSAPDGRKAHSHKDYGNCDDGSCAVKYDKHEHDDDDHDHDHGGEGGYKKEIIQIAVSAVFFALGLLLPLNEIAKSIILLIAYAAVGYPVLWSAVKNISKGRIFDENFLMALASVCAIIIGEIPEAVAVMLFYQVGELFQSMAVNNSRKSIKSLLNIFPEFANLDRDGNVVKVSPEEVRVGDIIEIYPGERIPLDGVVISGSTAVDTSALTGESVPREIKAGDDILSGCINKSGMVRVRVGKEFGESTAKKLMELVETSVEKKAKTENFITKFAKYYTPAVVLAAVLVAVVPPFFTDLGFTVWLNRALIFLVVSCPCALVISVPLSYFAGIGLSSKKGILVKGSNYLDALSRAKAVVFDKTGTLTEGKFSVSEIKSDSYSEDELLTLAAHAEAYSSHPIAESIREAYAKNGGKIDKNRVADYKEIAGKGISVTLDGKEIFAGNTKLFEGQNLPSIPYTCVYIGVDGKYAGYIAIADTPKANSKNAIKTLKSMGCDVAMLTGDNMEIGERVAKELGITEVHAQLMPKDKVSFIEKIQSRHKADEKTVFVGDGINDSPVLARADVGIAMGAFGSDSAIEAADVVLMNDDPMQVTAAISIAKRTRAIVLQNIIFALVVKFGVQILGVLGFANMWEAVFADVGVSIIAIFNAMRLMRKK